MCLREKIGPDPRNFNQRVSLGRHDLLIRTFLNCKADNMRGAYFRNVLYCSVIICSGSKLFFWRDGAFLPDWRQIQAMAVCFLLRAMDRHRNHELQTVPGRYLCTASVLTGSAFRSAEGAQPVFFGFAEQAVQHAFMQLNHFICQCGSGFFQHAHQDRMTPGC